MTTFYLDFAGGNDASDGTTFANRWKTITSGATAAPSAPGDSIPREVFFGRFTNVEIAIIYKAAAQNDLLFSLIKKMELNPNVNRTHADVINGLQLLEGAGLIGAGRAAEILG